jgi:anti-sigma factor RsiW
MNCAEIQNLLDGYVDDELDLVNDLQMERHLAECPQCSRAYENIGSLRSALGEDDFYYNAPADLRTRIRTALQEEDKPKRERASFWSWRWTPVFASLLVLAAAAIVLLTFVRASRSSDDLVAQEFVSAHIRSMMTENHLKDVQSTDQHTVKPWFDGKLDFAPPVIDLAAQGFPLTGGRLDYADGHPVAALVYGRRLHVINLFIYPTRDADSQNKVFDHQGYNVIHWNKAGMAFWAVSDVNVGDLQTFAAALQN